MPVMPEAKGVYQRECEGVCRVHRALMKQIPILQLNMD